MSDFKEKFGRGKNREFGEGNYIRGLPKTETQKFHDFSGGFDARQQVEDIDPKGSPYSINTDIDRQDRIFRVPGTSLLEAMGARTPEQLIIHAGLDLRSELLLLDAPWIGIKREAATVWTDIALDDGVYYYASYGPTILFSNGKDKVKKHEAGAATFEDTNVTQGADMCVFAGRLYVGGAVVGGQTQPMGVDWSGPDNYDDHVSGLGYGQEILLDDQTVGDHIVAMRAMNLDHMAILCRYGVWAGIKTGDPLRPADFQPRVKGLGCAVRETARNTLAGVLYLSDEGVCLFDGNNSTVISPQINDLLLPLDVNNLHRYRATYNPQTQQYVLFTPTFTFILDAVRGRWHRRTMTPLDGVPFPLQFHATTWAEMVGTWADHQATGETWKDLAPAESKAMRMVFVGADLHQEDATSLTQMGVAVEALWGSKKFEAPQNDRLVLTQWARIRYQGSGTVRIYLSDFNREYALSGADIALTPSVNPRLAKAGRSYTGLGLGIQLELLNLETKIHSLELDWVARGPRITNDVGPVVEAPIVLVPPGIVVEQVMFWEALGGTGAYHRDFPSSTTGFGPGGGGALTQTLQWDALLARYVYNSQIITTVGDANSYFNRSGNHHDIDVGHILHPSFARTRGIYRFRETLAHRKVAGTGRTRATFLLTCQGFPDNSVGHVGGAIGFISDYVAGVGVTQWETYFSNNNLTTLRRINTGVDSSGAHDLVIEIDGPNKRINWYIDRVLVDTFSPVAADIPVPAAATLFMFTISLNAQSNAGATTAQLIQAGIGALATVEYHDN